jgi:rubredoxin
LNLASERYRRIWAPDFTKTIANFELAPLSTTNKLTKGGYVCSICGYVYDPEQGDPDNGVAAGTKWEDVPDDWECPVCGAGKADFEKE